MDNEEVIQRRILFREKPPVRIIAQKSLEYTQTKDESTLQMIIDELEILEIYTKRLSYHQFSTLSDINYYEDIHKDLEQTYTLVESNLKNAKEQLVVERAKRKDLIDYENIAKQINKISTIDELEKEISEVDSQIDKVQQEIESRQELISQIKKHSGVLVYSLQQIKHLTGNI